MQESDCICHACFTKDRDGSNRLIEKNKGCLFPTNNPFWKYSQDIPNGVRTQSQEKNQNLVEKGEYNRYFRQKNQCNIRRWLEADESEVRLRSQMQKET